MPWCCRCPTSRKSRGPLVPSPAAHAGGLRFHQRISTAARFGNRRPLRDSGIIQSGCLGVDPDRHQHHWNQPAGGSACRDPRAVFFSRRNGRLTLTGHPGRISVTRLELAQDRWRVDQVRQALLVKVVDPGPVRGPGRQVIHLLELDPARRPSMKTSFPPSGARSRAGGAGGIGIDDVITRGALRLSPSAIDLADAIGRQAPGGSGRRDLDGAVGIKSPRRIEPTANSPKYW